jgi:hypothetical protein
MEKVQKPSNSEYSNLEYNNPSTILVVFHWQYLLASLKW